MTRLRSSESNINERIRRAGWFQGTKRDWQKLSIAKREEIAFEATGCEVAYPSWEKPVDCVHGASRVRRGELPPIALTEAILDAERASGFLGFIDEANYRKIRAAFIAEAKETGVYDPWRLAGNRFHRRFVMREYVLSVQGTSEGRRDFSYEYHLDEEHAKELLRARGKARERKVKAIAGDFQSVEEARLTRVVTRMRVTKEWKMCAPSGSPSAPETPA